MRPKDLSDQQIALELFPGYSDADTAIFEEFANPEAKPERGFIVDFLGSRIRVTSLWKEARGLEGQVLPIPVPADFHAEAIEWVGLLKSVRGACGKYSAMELGAGFGPWAIAGGVAARRKGINNIRLCAVEADPQHFQALRQHFSDNGFNPDEHSLFEAAVGTSNGFADWPILEDPAEQWGFRPMQGSRDHLGHEHRNTQRIPVLSMRDLVLAEACWDLIHIDVQGQEVDICRSCLDELNSRVRWIVVGTHSRKIDGDLLELMHGAGWVLENEKPAQFTFRTEAATLEAMTTIDGTQVWHNPRFFRAGEHLASFSQEITSSIREFHLEAGATCVIDIVTKNTGSQPWFGGGGPMSVNASYRWLDSGGVLPIEGNRALLSSGVVRPGESDSLNLQVTAPPKPGLYTLWITMVQEGVAWFYDRGAKPLSLKVVVT